MAAMAPVLVDWRASEPHRDKAPYAMLRNVNYGGNPLEKTTILHSVRVPLRGVEFAEFMLVPMTRGGLHAAAHHVQLRFVFRPGEQPEFLRLAGSRTGAHAFIPDLVLSWESWHGAGEHFNLIKGLDSGTYGLSLRAFAGPQRFLEDTLRGHDWFSFRLQMPGGQEGLTDLLKVSVALGDGVARHTISGLLERGEADWLRHAPEHADDAVTRQQWQRLQERMRYSEVKDARLHLPAEEQSYQSLSRSCATFARYTVLITTQRLIKRGYTDGVVLDKLAEPVLGETEPWMSEVAQANLTALFMHAPLALRYITRHPQAVPHKIPDELAAAGLVVQANGKARVVHYARGAASPYGPLGIRPA